MNHKKNIFILILFCCIPFCWHGCNENHLGEANTIELATDVQRAWIGADFWSNPLQDWQLNNGRIECIVSGGGRNVYLLTKELSPEEGAFEMSASIGRLDEGGGALDEGWIGFEIGRRGMFEDYRDNAVRGTGFIAGMTTGGKLFIGDLQGNEKLIKPPFQDIRLKIVVQAQDGAYDAVLSAIDKTGNLLGEIERKGLDAGWFHGGVALYCHKGPIPEMPEKRSDAAYGNWGFQPGTQRGGNVRFWFSDWQLSGSKVKEVPDQKFGPILFTQYTLSNKILKITTQMAPVSDNDPQTVMFEVKTDEQWEHLATAAIDPLSRTATFRVENWNHTQDIASRMVYGPYHSGSAEDKAIFEGVIRKEPIDKEEVVVAGFTGNNDLGFPNNDILKQIEYHNPDLLFFSGDQIYEGVGGFGAQRSPLAPATLDYLRKWYLYGWAYGDFMRDRPTIAIPDDHDVYHGNIWGAGGIATPPGLQGAAAQDEGGYKMPAEWVKMVERTQTSHLPDPYDPRPVAQSIGVYFCNMNYGGISFAVLEDRKFKSAPRTVIPEADVRNGWIKNLSFDPIKQGDAPGAKLLGERQLKFLNEWSSDWSNDTWMKVVLSQTIFANVATLPRGDATSDANVPKLRVLHEGEYPPDDIPVSDMDSNGWPQTGRNKAIKAMRKSFAFHIAGDQHLGSLIQYGVDNWKDAGYAFCVPAVSNVWPRRWYPNEAGKNPLPGAPRYSGDFEDGFGNKMTVLAVSNPVFTGLKPANLYDRATGYGIIRFNRKSRDISVECWPRLSDPSKEEAKQYPGWPVILNQADNYTKGAEYHLPKLEVEGMENPLIQVIDEKNGEIVFTLRINGKSYQPKVYLGGQYTLRIGDQDMDNSKEFKGLVAEKGGPNQTLNVKF